MGNFFTNLVLIVVVLMFLSSSIKIIGQTEEAIVERLGKYLRTLKPGLNFMIPFIDRIEERVILKEQILDTTRQQVITKDNVSTEMDAIVYYKIIDSYKSVYGIQGLERALANLAITNLRNIAGNLELDQILNSRDNINIQMLSNLDNAVEQWGVDVIRVEIQNITPPSEVTQSMERQMKAEREKRARILEAEAYKQSEVLRAEGEKDAKLLRAEAEKLSAIKFAEGESESLMLIAQAKKKSFDLISEANISEKVLAIEKLNAFEKMSENAANKVIIPSELTSVANIGAVFAESANTTKK